MNKVLKCCRALVPRSAGRSSAQVNCMRHRKKGKTLGREKAHREALLRNLAESLILHGSVRTTKAKAQELRTVVEPLVTKAKAGTLTARRELISRLYTARAVNKLMDDWGPRYRERPGGYTRMVKLGRRANDAAAVVKIELV